MCDHDHEPSGQSYLNILVQHMSPFSLHLIILVWWLAGANSSFPNSNLSFSLAFTEKGCQEFGTWNVDILELKHYWQLLLEFFKCFHYSYSWSKFHFLYWNPLKNTQWSKRWIYKIFWIIPLKYPTNFQTFQLEKGRIFKIKSESVGRREHNLFVNPALWRRRSFWKWKQFSYRNHSKSFSRCVPLAWWWQVLVVHGWE